MDDLEKRVQQFASMSLPGQMPVMHIGTSYLVNDLWREVKRLRAALEYAEQGLQSDELQTELREDDDSCQCSMCGDIHRRR